MADLASGFEAVHDWHVEVEQDDTLFTFRVGLRWSCRIGVRFVIRFGEGFVGIYGFLAVGGEQSREAIAVGD